MGREAEGAAGVVALSFQPFAGMPLTPSLSSTPSASTRDPPQFFNSLLALGHEFAQVADGGVDFL